MKLNKLPDIIQIDFLSITPKYTQIVNSVTNAVTSGKIKEGAVLPSINELSNEFEISRDTAEKAYKQLKVMGILGSVPGKGYFIKSAHIAPPIKVCLIFNKLSLHKKIIYDAFVEALGEKAMVDFYVYNNDSAFFRRIMERISPGDYSHFVIIPHFLDHNTNAVELINQLPPEKLILMDKLVETREEPFGSVVENFEKDLFMALEQLKPLLQKYRTLKLIFPKHTYHPHDIIKGFEDFAQKHKFKCRVVNSMDKEPVKTGDVFINLMDDDLVMLLEKLLVTTLKLGKDIGLISYNETPLKKLFLKGITTVSTDFQYMGRRAAEMIRNNEEAHVEVPFIVTERHSL